MITCKFAGGLGNNLFQFANVFALHKRHNVPYCIQRDFQRLTFDGKLLKDELRFKQAHVLEFQELFENKLPYIEELSVNTKNMSNYYHHDLDGSSNFLFSEVKFKDNTMYHGYYQSDKYFADSNLKEELVLNKQIIDTLKNKHAKFFNKPTISLQYRLGGDRKLNKIQKFHKNLNPSYYKRAVEEISTITNNNISDFNILVFSDDLELAKRALSYTNLDCYYIKNKNNIEDFAHMSICDHNVIGNSTFAWWAAYMNKNNGLVVAPKDFFGKKYSNFLLDDFYPAEWIIL